MKFFNIVLLLLLGFAIPLNAQWSSFELNQLNQNKFEQQVEPLLKTISLSSSRHFISPAFANKRLGIGASYSHGANLTDDNYSSELIGGYPNLAAILKITENLSLKGNISLFNSNDDNVQSFAYGFGLNLTNKENNNWKISALFSKLQGPDDLINRSIDAMIVKEFTIGKVDLFSGLGINTFKTTFLFDDMELFPRKLKGSSNNMLIGAQIVKGNIVLIPVFQINTDVIVMSIEIMGIFK